MDDDAFIRAILAAPADDLPRLVYADWLDERNHPAARAKAEFLRLTAGSANAHAPRLKTLAARLDPAWLAAVSRLPLENCPAKRAEAQARQELPLRFDYLCDRRWEDLTAAADGAVRHCDGCQQPVHFCRTIGEAQRHAWEGHCVTVNLGVTRHPGDLEPRPMLVGLIVPPRSEPTPIAAPDQRPRSVRLRRRRDPN